MQEIVCQVFTQDDEIALQHWNRSLFEMTPLLTRYSNNQITTGILRTITERK